VQEIANLEAQKQNLLNLHQQYVRSQQPPEPPPELSVPVLKNQHWELFAQEIAKGSTATKAYETAGYARSNKNAARLKAKDEIRARVYELQGMAARSAVITIESVCAELDQAIQVAMKGNQAAAMVSAAQLKAKLAGLLTDRVEISEADPFASGETPEECATIWLRSIAAKKGHEFTRDEISGFAKVLAQCFEAIDGYIAGCCAKAVPAQPTMSAHDQELIERRRLGLRITNGNRR
jgi:hypothetical protein